MRWPDEVIDALKRGDVDELSLDHDLGDDKRGTGYDVLLWIEEEVHRRPAFDVPHISIHSANPVGRARMEAAIRAIERRGGA